MAAKIPPPSLPLFTVTQERAWQLVEKYGVDGVLYQDMRTNNGREYGPYWFARVNRKGIYVGSDEKKRELEEARELVRRELESASSSPEVQRLRQLEARARRRGGPKRAREREVVDVPILGVIGAGGGVGGRPRPK